MHCIKASASYLMPRSRLVDVWPPGVTSAVYCHFLLGVFHLSRFLMVCKVYKLFGKLFEKLWEGIMLNRYSFAPCDLFLVKWHLAKTWVVATLCEGVPIL